MTGVLGSRVSGWCGAWKGVGQDRQTMGHSIDRLGGGIDHGKLRVRRMVRRIADQEERQFFPQRLPGRKRDFRPDTGRVAAGHRNGRPGCHGQFVRSMTMVEARSSVR